MLLVTVLIVGLPEVVKRNQITFIFKHLDGIFTVIPKLERIDNCWCSTTVTIVDFQHCVSVNHSWKVRTIIVRMKMVVVAKTSIVT